jgi:hypothetical protein
MLKSGSPFLFIFVLVVVLLLARTASPGPPFLTDDPEPVEFKHWEAYLFATADATPKQTNAMGPAFEFNMGVLPNLQFHLVVPMAFSSPADGPRAYGLGDIEFGLKYRFIQETDNRPMVGVFPMLEIPTGDSERSGQWPGMVEVAIMATEELGTMDDLWRRRLCHQSGPKPTQLLLWRVASPTRFR